MGTDGPFPGCKARPRRDADHSPHLVPRSRMSRSYTSSPPLRLHVCAVRLLSLLPMTESLVLILWRFCASCDNPFCCNNFPFLTRGVTVAIRILPFTSVTKTRQQKKNNGNIKMTQCIFSVLVFEQCYRKLCPHARVMADLACLFTIIPNRHLLISVSSCQFERKKQLKIFISFYFILFHFISLIAIKHFYFSEQI
jgi:hypothetical protein